MSEQDRYRGSAAQRSQNRAGESQWQRDYGQRNQRFDSVPGVDDVHNRLTVRKAFLKDVADRVLGNEAQEHHAHGGTKTTTASASTGASSSSATRTANAHN